MKKLSLLFVVATMMVALTSYIASDVGKVPSKKSPQLAQAQNIDQPGCTVVANILLPAVVEVSSVPLNSSTVALTGIGGAEKVNLSSITKTEKDAESLVESDVAYLVTNTGQIENVAKVSMVKSSIDEMNLVVSVLPPSNCEDANANTTMVF